MARWQSKLGPWSCPPVQTFDSEEAVLAPIGLPADFLKLNQLCADGQGHGHKDGAASLLGPNWKSAQLKEHSGKTFPFSAPWLNILAQAFPGILKGWAQTSIELASGPPAAQAVCLDAGSVSCAAACSTSSRN
eukprot:6469366-Amphidinium_carterae.1